MADSSSKTGIEDVFEWECRTASIPLLQARAGASQNQSGLLSSDSVLNILRLIFAGAPLSEILTIIAQLVEGQGDGMLCTIFLLDKDAKHVRCATAPSLPGFIPHIGSIPVGPKHASCGTAVFRREPVYVTDILSDPLWDEFRHLLLPYDLRALWARPLLSSDGTVLGTFASYYHKPRNPSATDLQLIEHASHIAGIAIERHLKDEDLRRSEAYLMEAQKLSMTGSFRWIVSTDSHYWSAETFRIFEYDPSSKVTLQLVIDRAHPQDLHIIEEKMALAKMEHDFDYECRFLMPDGSVKHLHVVAHGSRDREGQLEFIGAVQDITERHLSEEALGKVRSELAHMARVTSLGALTASIAHEVNHPLSGIVTNASTCLRMLSADPPNVDGALETARRTIRDGKRASEVITRLRALFGKKDVSMERVDLNEATQEVITLSLSELQRERVILRQELALDLPPVTGDRVQLQQVILNLLRNASDAMNSVDDRPRQLVIKTEKDRGDFVCLSVRDTGIGIALQDFDRLFDAFYTTKNAGMGMGLSISRTNIENHSGRLWATPNDSRGTTFSFSIPRRSEGVPAQPESRPTGAHSEIGSVTIMRDL